MDIIDKMMDRIILKSYYTDSLISFIVQEEGARSKY
jgi:hypothetical protein